MFLLWQTGESNPNFVHESSRAVESESESGVGVEESGIFSEGGVGVGKLSSFGVGVEKKYCTGVGVGVGVKFFAGTVLES